MKLKKGLERIPSREPLSFLRSPWPSRKNSHAQPPLSLSHQPTPNNNQPPLVGSAAPDFKAEAVYDQEFQTISLSQYKVRIRFFRFRFISRLFFFTFRLTSTPTSTFCFLFVETFKPTNRASTSCSSSTRSTSPSCAPPVSKGGSDEVERDEEREREKERLRERSKLTLRDLKKKPNFHRDHRLFRPRPGLREAQHADPRRLRRLAVLSPGLDPDRPQGGRRR